MPESHPQRSDAGSHLKTGRVIGRYSDHPIANHPILGVIMNIPERLNHEAQNYSLGEEAREIDEEARKIRRLQLMMSMVMSVIGQDPSLTVEEASELAAGAKRAALAMFPDKELAFDLLYKPRLQRLMKERFRLQ
jgi:phosphopantothenate synthetase